MWLIHLIRLAPSHLLISRPAPASRSASRRASRLAYLPASFHLIGSYLPASCLPASFISFISSAHHPRQSDETSDEQAKRRTRRAIDNGEAEHHDIRSIRTTPMPLPARRIAPTSRMTHGSHTNTPTRKRPLHGHYNASDGQHKMINGTTTRRPSQRRLSAYRQDDKARRLRPPPDTSDGTPNDTAIATRPTTRRHGTKSGTRETGRPTGRPTGRKKTGRLCEKKGGPKTERNMRLDDMPLTTQHPNWNRNPLANEGNQEDENDSIHIAPVSSQSPPGYHR